MIETDHLEQVAREERGCLWGDLDEARPSTVREQRSIWCAPVNERVQTLTLLVAPTPWGEIQTPLLRYGIHQRIPAGLSTKVTVGNASRSSV